MDYGMALEDRLSLKDSFSLGRAENLVFFYLSENGTKFFTNDDIVRRFGKKIPKDAIRNLLFQLENKRRIRRIERGKYLLAPAQSGLEGNWSANAFAVADFIAPKPYYLSYYSALFFLNATEQIPRTVYVVTTRQKKSVEFNGTTYRFICRKASEKGFGANASWTAEAMDDRKVNIATREQALLDCLDQPGYCGGITEAVKLFQGLDWEKISSKVFNANSAVQRRLAYMMDLFGIRNGLWWRFQSKRFEGYRLLDPTRASKGTYSTRFGLRLNVDRKELLQEVIQRP